MNTLESKNVRKRLCFHVLVIVYRFFFPRGPVYMLVSMKDMLSASNADMFKK